MTTTAKGVYGIHGNEEIFLGSGDVYLAGYTFTRFKIVGAGVLCVAGATAGVAGGTSTSPGTGGDNPGTPGTGTGGTGTGGTGGDTGTGAGPANPGTGGGGTGGGSTGGSNTGPYTLGTGGTQGAEYRNDGVYRHWRWTVNGSGLRAFDSADRVTLTDNAGTAWTYQGGSNPTQIGEGKFTLELAGGVLTIYAGYYTPGYGGPANPDARTYTLTVAQG